MSRKYAKLIRVSVPRHILEFSFPSASAEAMMSRLYSRGHFYSVILVPPSILKSAFPPVNVTSKSFTERPTKLAGIVSARVRIRAQELVIHKERSMSLIGFIRRCRNVCRSVTGYTTRSNISGSLNYRTGSFPEWQLSERFWAVTSHELQLGFPD